MACNCETQNEIDRLYKIYGDKTKLKDKPKLLDYVKYYGGNIVAYTLAFICMPLLLLHVLFLLFWREDGRIHISDIDLIKRFEMVKK